MFLLLWSELAALLYAGKNTGDKPVSQKGTESESGAEDFSLSLPVPTHAVLFSISLTSYLSICTSSLWLESSVPSFEVAKAVV